MRPKSGTGHAVPTIMKIALSFSIAASWPGLDLDQTSTFSQRLPKMRGRRTFNIFVQGLQGLRIHHNLFGSQESRKGMSEIEGQAAKEAVSECSRGRRERHRWANREVERTTWKKR